MTEASKQIEIGDSVAVLMDNNQSLTVVIKPSKEIDPQNGFISSQCPLGQALLHKHEGDEFEYTVGAKTFKGKVVRIYSSSPAVNG